MIKESLTLVLIVLMISSVSAFVLSNSSIQSEYGSGDTLKGWINLSLEEQDSNSLLSAFNSEISLLDFLENNSLILGDDYSCFPSDCETNYVESNRELNKTYSLNPNDKIIFGIKITGDIQSIDSFSMKIKSDAEKSGYPQLFVDILDDWEIEWQPHEFSGEYGNPIYGCYETGTDTAEITQTEYCEKIELTPASKIKIGADVKEVSGKGGNADFLMTIYNEDEDGSCTASASGDGKVECEVDMQIKEPAEFFVCIKTEDYTDNNKYAVLYEKTQPCGFSGDGDYEYDFPIFVRPGGYAALGEVIINQDEADKYNGDTLVYYIGDYIDERYNNKCSEVCMIPVKIISGDLQTLTISDIQLSYTSGISKTERYLNDLKETPATLDMDFQVLELEKSGIKVPTPYGDKLLILKLGEEEILQKTIKILKLGTIESLFPLQAAAAVPVRFSVYASGNISEYAWNFGDGAEITTEENYTYHVYNETGTYDLKITVLNPQGSSSRIFSIKVNTPEKEVNETLKEKRAYLEGIISSLSRIEAWYASQLEEQIGLENIESELDNLEIAYNKAGPEDYVNIMNSLYDLKVPKEIQEIKFSGEFLPFPDNINPSYLVDFGYREENPEEYAEGIVLWMATNLNVELENSIFNLKYDDETVPVFTGNKLKITPIDSVKEAYLIIQDEDIIFKEDYGEEEVSGATGIKMSIEKQKTIEFISEGKVEAIDLQAYISPKFSELPEKIDVGPCDNDGKCEKETEENRENCPNDCHGINWLRILVFIIFLFCVFVVYIILQEWYKKYYQRHLFKNKNDLYNLMSFIFNALKQGKDKRTIHKTLKQYKWKNEQIAYAYRKLLGKRTGMWEIPIFRAFEKKKVREELAKRGQMYSPKMVQ
ncbi:hypothetical protein A3K73_02015 [Candidatus Pacearchaeota archaeon RBG_13_36_9]|nr:MAG: hypothetical protein A3K73_02015 [Candidatus Pacearchaeota archaeon RBG_13_36_9]